jgi:hypothetical protein
MMKTNRPIYAPRYAPITTLPSKSDDRRAGQTAMVKRMREESVIGPDIPFCHMGVPPSRAQHGPSVEEYFRAKHARGDFGRFFPLHRIVIDHRRAA